MYVCPYSHIYWTDVGSTPAIERSNLDGSARTAIHTAQVYWPVALTLDLENGLMYWSDIKRHVIEMSRLDGTGRRVLPSASLRQPFAISQFAGRLYWVDPIDRDIKVADQFNGSIASVLSSRLYVPTDIKVVSPLKQKSCKSSEM